MIWNKEFPDSELLCGTIEGKIKIWPNRQEIEFEGFLNGTINEMIKNARREDEMFRKYLSPVVHKEHYSPLFFGMFRIVLFRIAIGNGWQKV